MSDFYFELFGAVIRQALDDARLNTESVTDKNSKMRKYWILEARDFLNTDRLEEYIERHGVSDIVTAGAIRIELDDKRGTLGR